MKDSRGGRAFTLGLLGLLCVFLAQTTGLGNTARLVPGTVVVFTVLLMIVQVARETWRRPVRASRRAGEAPPAPHPHESEPRPGSRASLVAVGWIVLLPVLVVAFGFLPAIAIYAASYLRFRASVGWRGSALVAGALSCLVYLIFERLLGAPLDRGYFPGLLPY